MRLGYSIRPTGITNNKTGRQVPPVLCADGEFRIPLWLDGERVLKTLDEWNGKQPAQKRIVVGSEWTCRDCGCDISHRHRLTTRCEACHHEVIKAKKRLAYKNLGIDHLEAELRSQEKRCVVCGCDISHRRTAKYCEEHSKEVKLKQQKKRYEDHISKLLKKETIARRAREGRFCGACGEDISDLGGSAKWCMKCRKTQYRLADNARKKAKRVARK